MMNQTGIDGRLSLTGDHADIEINGVSLSDTLAAINEKLAILVPNPALEQESAELAAIRREYIKLEKQLIEKKLAWELLNK
jgi:hypothetical protein